VKISKPFSCGFIVVLLTAFPLLRADLPTCCNTQSALCSGWRLWPGPGGGFYDLGTNPFFVCGESGYDDSCQEGNVDCKFLPPVITLIHADADSNSQIIGITQLGMMYGNTELDQAKAEIRQLKAERLGKKI
jgi:hypothetical protein